MDPANYYPVSNTQFLGKIVERVVAEQLQIFMDNFFILGPFQSGFHPGYGKEIAVVSPTDDFRRHLDHSQSALKLLLDLTAVFDMVDYALMTLCLTNAGI